MGVVNVQTIPAIPGSYLSKWMGKQYTTGGEWKSLTIPVNTPGVHRLTIMVNLYNDPSQRIEFSRWLDGSVQHIPGYFSAFQK